MVEWQKIEANRWYKDWEKGAGITIFIPDNADVKAKTISRNKDFIKLRKTQTIMCNNQCFLHTIE